MQWQRGGAQVAQLEEELAGRLDGSVACKHRRAHAARRSPPMARHTTCISLGPVYFVAQSSTKENTKHTAL